LRLSRRCGATPEAAAETGREAALLPRPNSRSEKLANTVCTVLLIAAAFYFLAHTLAAWLRGSFEVAR
jgi:hypothetical protein